MDTAYIPYRVHQCFKCPDGMQFYCESCSCDLCSQCKENHVYDLQTIDHDVVSYRDIGYFIPTQEICATHPGNIYIKYCKPCQVPICYSSFEDQSHRFNSFLFGQGQHEILDIQGAYKTKRQQHKGNIHAIRSEALFVRPVLLSRIRDDFKTCRTRFSRFQSEILTKAQTLKYIIDCIQHDFMCNVFCDFDFKHRCLKQKKEMNRHIVILQKYVHIYEQSASCALQFLSSVKTYLPQIYPKLHTSQLSVTQSLHKIDVIEPLIGIQISERGQRLVENGGLLKLMSGAEFHHSFSVAGVDRCYNLSCVTSDRVWVSNKNNLLLTNTRGVTQHHVQDSCRDYISYGLHTVNSESELIYIDRNYNINKLSKDMKKSTTFIEKTYFAWKPRCVYWSPSTGNLLVGMYKDDKSSPKGKVGRYNQRGQMTHIIQYDNTGRGLYNKPNYITENTNGDVVVSDFHYAASGAVVVTERGGRHLFSYGRRSSESGLRPQGICTDSLSHILLCDDKTETVQMLNKNGMFLSYLLTKSQELGRPWSLSYDVNTHRLWVGSLFNNKVCVFRYMTRQDVLTDHSQVIKSKIPPKKAKQENECQLKLMFLPKLNTTFTVAGVSCRHISFLTSDRIWVNDWNDLILTDTKGKKIHCVKDTCRGLYKGLQTINSENELIYIDSKFNIKKLSKDMEKTTTIIERTDSTWEPRCVYWSPSTGDLLIGMYYIDIATGKVVRYNQNGQLTKTIQLDNAGRDMYRGPYYITENNNGDVVVSDYEYTDKSGAVVVTDRCGTHRFSYNGRPPKSELRPRGICTDALSHILVCDDKSKSVHILNKDGRFQSCLLTTSQVIGGPCSLCYDVNTHLLWVGSRDNNTVAIYKYISRQDALTDKHLPKPDGDALSSSILACEWK